MQDSQTTKVKIVRRDKVKIVRRDIAHQFLECSLTFVYAKLILHYQHKIRNYQPKWKKQKSRKRSIRGEVARSKVTRKRAQEGQNSIVISNFIRVHFNFGLC